MKYIGFALAHIGILIDLNEILNGEWSGFGGILVLLGITLIVGDGLSKRPMLERKEEDE